MGGAEQWGLSTKPTSINVSLVCNTQISCFALPLSLSILTAIFLVDLK